MTMGRTLCIVFLAWASAAGARAQPQSPALSPAAVPPATETVSLTVPSGTVLQVALEKEVRVRKVGQSIQGRLVEPVYAFDQEVLPVGSEVWGRIAEIEAVPGKRRFLAALNVDFTPTRKVGVEFEEIILPGGIHIPMDTVVTPGSGQRIQLITTVDNDKKKAPRGAAGQKMKEAVREAKRKWQEAIKQVKEPGKMHRLKRFALAQLPVHPQYIDAGTVYFAELQEPLHFGSKPLPPPTLALAGTSPPPCGLLAHAQLVTPLSSDTAQEDDPVEAVLTQPLFSGDQLVFPQGTRLKGTVVRARPARRLKRNGKLRILFSQVVPPDGIQYPVDANLEGIQAATDQHLKLGPESGTQSSSPKRRYVSTGIAVALAVTSYQDSDAEDGVTDTRGNASQGAAGGAVAFKLVGIVVGTLVRSRSLALGMGVYGAGRSAYSNFLGRGRDVVFPKGTAMEIGFWLAESCEDSAQAD